MIPRRGTSLLEAVVAISITATLALIGLEALRMLADGSVRLRYSTRDVVHAATTRRLLRTWLENASVFEAGGEPFQGTHRDHRSLPDDELSFLTTAPTPIGHGLVLVRLFIDRDIGTPERGLVAEFRQSGGVDASRLELVADADAVRFRYFTDLLGEPRWIETWTSSVLLPHAILLELSPGRGARLDPLLALPLTAIVEGGR